MGAASSQHAGTIHLPHLRGEMHWAHYGIQGKRESMEDTFSAEALGNEAVFGVFDGHYGKRAAVYAAENLARVFGDNLNKPGVTIQEQLKNSFLSLDKQLLDKSRLENWHDGTTALVALLTMTDSPTPTQPPKRPTSPSVTATESKKASKQSPLLSLSASSSEDWGTDEPVVTDDGLQRLSMYIANAGDCRAISVYGDGRVFQLTTDHTPLLPYERWRIFKAGGNVKFGRIEGKLSVSRGFGDRQFKEPRALVSALPEVISFEVTQNLRFVILACDGVWGWLNNMQVGQFVAKMLKDGNRPEVVCKELVKFAFDSGSTDNISVVLLYFTFHSENYVSPAFLSPPVSPRSSMSQSSASGTMPPTSPPGSSKSVQGTTGFALEDLTAPKSSNGGNNPSGTSGSSKKSSKSQHQRAHSVDDSRSQSIVRPNSPPVTEMAPGSAKSSSNAQLTASARSKKYNFGAVAESMRWTLDVDLVDRRADRALVITTHIATGEVSLLDQSEYDSTSDMESLDPRHSVDLVRPVSPISTISSSQTFSTSEDLHDDINTSSSNLDSSDPDDEDELYQRFFPARSRAPHTQQNTHESSPAIVGSPASNASSTTTSSSTAGSRQENLDPSSPPSSVSDPVFAPPTATATVTTTKPSKPMFVGRRGARPPFDDDEDLPRYPASRSSSSAPNRKPAVVSPPSKSTLSLSPEEEYVAKLTAPRRRPKHATYGLSDSESSSDNEFDLTSSPGARRRSFDDLVSMATTAAANRRKQRRLREAQEAKEAETASSGKSKSNKKSGVKSPKPSKKNHGVLSDEEYSASSPPNGDLNALNHRRAASFDVPRAEKKQKKSTSSSSKPKVK